MPPATLVQLSLNEIEGVKRFLKELPLSEFQEVFCVGCRSSPLGAKRIQQKNPCGVFVG